MKITQTPLAPGSRDPSLEPSPFRPTSRQRPEERQTEYRPLSSPPDEAPLLAVIKSISSDVASQRDLDAQIVERMNTLSADLSAFTALREELDRQNEGLLKVRAAALIDDQELDATPFTEKIDRLNSEIRQRAKHVDVTKAALSSLQVKREKLAASLSELEREYAKAAGRWLDARHWALIEKFRSEFHGLHTTLAELFAVERHAFFTGSDRAGRFFDRLSSAVAYDSPFRPDWINAVGYIPTFPGISAAEAALEAEIEFRGDVA